MPMQTTKMQITQCKYALQLALWLFVAHKVEYELPVLELHVFFSWSLVEEAEDESQTQIVPLDH